MKKPKPPKSLQEVRDYIKEKNLNVDAEFFWSYFEAGNWHDKKGDPVLSWKQKLLTWHGRDKLTARKQAKKKEREAYRQRARAYRQHIRNDYGEYLKSKSTKALQDIKKDGGYLSELTGWLIDEILEERNG